MEEWIGGSYTGSITQSDSLRLNSYDPASIDVGFAEYSTQTIRVNPGQSISTEMTVLQTSVGLECGLWLTSRNGSGPSFTDAAALLSTTWEMRAGDRFDVYGAYGSGTSRKRERFVTSAPNAIGNTLLLRIDWVTESSAVFSALRGGESLGEVTLDFAYRGLPVNNGLYVGLRSKASDVVFDNVTYSPVPEPSVSMLVMLALCSALPRTRA